MELTKTILHPTIVTCHLETKGKAIASQLSRKTRLFVKARIAMAIVGSLEQRGRVFIKTLKTLGIVGYLGYLGIVGTLRTLGSLRSLKFLKSLFLVLQALLFDKVGIIEIVDAHGFAHLVHCLCSRFTSLFSTFL